MIFNVFTQKTIWALRTVFIVFLSGLFLLTGCPQSPENSDATMTGLYTDSLRFDGQQRRFDVFVPSSVGRNPVPMIFELHGGGIYIEDLTGQSGHKTPYKLWMTLAEREKFIVVFPEGLNGAYGKPTWNDCRGNCRVSSSADDVGFISAIIDTLSLKYPIDSRRIYVSGTSNGGMMALRLAIELPEKIAAVAAVAAAMPDSSECPTPTHPISVLFMNGTADNHLPYNGGYVSDPPKPDYGSVLSTPASVHIWTTLDRTDTIPVIDSLPDLDKKDGSTVVRYSYLNGVHHTSVVLYKIIGGGHSAPSIAERYSWLFRHYFGNQNHDIEMTDVVWNFFKDKQRE